MNMNSRDWVTAGTLAGVIGGAVLAAGLARSDGKRAAQMRKRLQREAKRLRKETRRLARDTEDWVERARRHAPAVRTLARRLDHEDLRETATEALASKAAAVKQTAAEAARGTRDLLAGAASSAGLDTAYARARPYLGGLPWLMTGTLYAALLHALSAEGGRPVRRLVRRSGNGYEGTQGAGRLGVHLLYGVATALAFELLAEWRKRRMGSDA